MCMRRCEEQCCHQEGKRRQAFQVRLCIHWQGDQGKEPAKCYRKGQRRKDHRCQVLHCDQAKERKEDEEDNNKVLPEIGDNETCSTTNVDSEQHFTNPPARYTEAKLIKEMEELGIGRPSTYATIIDTIKSHDYVTLEEKKYTEH